MKKIVFILLGFFMITSFVSASPSYGLGGGLGYGMAQLVDIVENMAYPLTEALFGSSDYMFEKVLFLVVLISVISVALNQVRIFNGKSKSEKSIRWIVTVAVSLIAVRFLVETDLIKAMMLPYGVLGAVLTSVLPFIIYYFFTIGVFPYANADAGSKIGRKVMWIFFAVVFMGVWGSRVDEMGDLAWIYFFTAVASIILLLLDGTIGRAMRLNNLKKGHYNRTQDRLFEAEDKLKKLRKKYLNEEQTPQLKDRIDNTEKVIDDLQKRLNKIV